ncbi:MAG: serine hydrolase domain-containing protein [Marinicella sp.]
MKTSIMKILIIFYLCICCCISIAQTNIDLSFETKERINKLFSEFDHLNSPGYAIGISKNEHTLYKKGYGSANLDYSIPITSNSAFSIASVSKQFTAASIALLILDNKITLDTPAAKYIPELNQYPDKIKIKHLIYNTSGIPDYHSLPRQNNKSWITFNYFDIDECIATSLAQEKLLFTPGTKWDYSNVNFMLLTKIVEKVSGHSFSTFTKEHLFQPLGMHHTMINDDVTSVVKNRVTPYNIRTTENIKRYANEGIKINNQGNYIQHQRNAPHYGGSGVITTIDDLLIWSKNMVTKRFKGDSLYNLMHHTIKFEHDRDNQAFGLYIGEYKGRKTVAWDGGDWGISSQLLRFPDQGIAIITLSNLGSGEAYRKVNAIADILIEDGILE